ncbi:MAG: molybdenum cofactor guanylyltransferase [Gemmatimonadaceae bacterium]
MRRCVGVILAGGGATRYGGKPKGLELVGGQRVIDRAAMAIASATDELLLIANDAGASGWLPGVRTVSDVRHGAGSLGGIYSALVHADSAAMVIAWDMPFVPAELLRELRRLGETADAAVPESDSRRGVEPLCAYYSPVCVAPIERRLNSGDLRVISFYDEIRVAKLPIDAVRRFGDPARIFMNVNSPVDLDLAEHYESAANGGRDRQEAQREDDARR